MNAKLERAYLNGFIKAASRYPWDNSKPARLEQGPGDTTNIIEESKNGKYRKESFYQGDQQISNNLDVKVPLHTRLLEAIQSTKYLPSHIKQNGGLRGGLSAQMEVIRDGLQNDYTPLHYVYTEDMLTEDQRNKLSKSTQYGNS